MKEVINVQNSSARHGRFQFLCATAWIHEVYENNGKKTSSLLVCIRPRTVHHITVWLAHAGKESRLNMALPQVLMAKVMQKIPMTFIIMPVFAWEKQKVKCHWVRLLVTGAAGKEHLLEVVKQLMVCLYIGPHLFEQFSVLTFTSCKPVTITSCNWSCKPVPLCYDELLKTFWIWKWAEIVVWAEQTRESDFFFLE